MDIMDEAVRPRRNPKAGKTGCNSSDLNKLKRMLDEGSSADEISAVIGVRLSVVEKFVDHFSKPAPATDEAEAPASTKKTKKKKAKKKAQ